MMANCKPLQTYRQFMDSKQAIQGQYGSGVGHMLVHLRSSGSEPGDEYEVFSLVKNPKCRKGRSSIPELNLKVG